MNRTLQRLFSRDLQKLKEEISLYQNEENIWLIDHHISNSAGNLCLHLVGNLNTYIGAPFANTGYIRDRPYEFAAKGVPRAALLSMIDETILVVNEALNNITADQLQQKFPILIFNDQDTTEFILTHLATHLGYHLGQINYHRRLLDR
ncbi:MAG TPA: DUF1572 family protein [Saprospiraceae bacterium]|nr:DUF1572 family protein [Saprospiraceae bacterium]HPN70407.1 DUF1572 family protein [Saprospiraceae bacterium]